MKPGKKAEKHERKTEQICAIQSWGGGGQYQVNPASMV